MTQLEVGLICGVIGVILTAIAASVLNRRPCAPLDKLAEAVSALTKEVEAHTTILSRHGERIGGLEQARATAENEDKWVKKTLTKIERDVENIHKQLLKA